MSSHEPDATQRNPSAITRGASTPCQVQLSLTGRETQIAGLIALGQTSGQLALELGVSNRTVDAHAEHIRKKLKLRSRVQIAGQSGMECSAPRLIGKAGGNPRRASRGGDQLHKG